MGYHIFNEDIKICDVSDLKGEYSIDVIPPIPLGTTCLAIKIVPTIALSASFDVVSGKLDEDLETNPFRWETSPMLSITTKINIVPVSDRLPEKYQAFSFFCNIGTFKIDMIIKGEGKLTGTFSSTGAQIENEERDIELSTAQISEHAQLYSQDDANEIVTTFTDLKYELTDLEMALRITAEIYTGLVGYVTISGDQSVPYGIDLPDPYTSDENEGVVMTIDLT